jgi:hypothetical protein
MLLFRTESVTSDQLQLLPTMKSDPTRQIEVLESRIAPARIIVAGIPNTIGTDTDYNEAPFVNTEANQLDPISAAVGGGLPGVADTFYLRLQAGDRLQLFRTSAGASVEDFLIVQSGNLVVFFIDKEDSNGNRDNEVSEAEIVGISASNNAKFELKAALPGDIVYNLIDQGTPNLADDVVVMGGAMQPGMNVKGFTVGSSVGATISNAGIPERVGGKVLASGNISNVIISGDVGAILAGGAGNAETFDFFPKYVGAGGLVVDTPGGNGVFNFSPAPGKAGSSIKNVLVDSITDRVEAGVGGEGARGGQIAKLIVRSDSTGFEIRAGDGGTSGAAKKNGGAGGSVSSVFVAGADDSTGNSQVVIAAGLGGDSTGGVGGVGGSVSNVFIGYTLLNGKPLLSNEILRDNVTIAGGIGGDGKIGGKGGKVSSLDVLVSTPEGPGDELSVIGGAGGNSVVATGGRAGIGGSVSNSAIRNAEASIGSDIGVRAGDGGFSVGTGVGASGGSVAGLKLLGRQIQVEAGDGSDGKIGGKGGSLSNLFIEQRNGVVADAILFNAGIGGDGNSGNAGKGGDVTTIIVDNSDVNVFEINSGIQGNGGESVGGKGGNGGKVAGISILDTDANATKGVLNLITARSGSGGDGDKGGGNGGLFSTFSIVGVNLEPTLSSGSGGDALLKGKGGKGGQMSAIEAAILGTVRKLIGGELVDVDSSTFIFAGTGGNGAGVSGNGGAGGGVSAASVNTPGFGTIVAGDGGLGVGAKAGAGKGGSIISAGVFAGNGEGQLIAGDAGAVGGKPAAGGSILGTSSRLSGLFAELSLTIRAGDGSGGGAGGSIMNLGYGSTESDLVPTPKGSILVQAGNGTASPDGKFVGKGGSIVNVGGSVNSENGSTTIRAGDGGSALKKGANGGSISGLSLQRGGALGIEFSVRAGDGGDAPQGARGANGGSVTGVNVVEIAKESVFRNIAAGDGGDALSVGGKGGSVSKINVLDHDIGVRFGENYGFQTMGGIFAGAGGVAAKEGANGSVTVVNADAISAIVAGRAATPKLVSKVENIYLNGAELLKDSTGVFLPNLPGSEQVFVFGGGTVVGVESTPGSTVVAEVQTIDLLSVQGLPLGKTYVLSLDGEETTPLAGNASATEIQTALNALNVVRATGPGNSGTVSVVGPDLLNGATFTITFSNAAAVNGVISAVVEADITDPLPLTATPAEVQAELNQEPLIIAAGGVTVRLARPNGYEITFNTPSNQTQIVGREVIDITSTDIAPGVGNTLLAVTESLSGGNEVHSFNPIAPFKFSITYTEGADVNSTVQISPNATADEIELALLALPTLDPGDIDVVKRVSPAFPAGQIEVIFQDLTDHPTLQVTMYADALTVEETVPGTVINLIKEKQTIKIDPIGGGQITFGFGLDSFAMNVPAGITAQALSDLLNLQPSVIAQGGITLTSSVANTFEIEFGANGDQQAIVVQEDSYPLGFANVITEGTAAIGEVVRFTHQVGSQVRFGFNGGVSALITPSATTGLFTTGQIKAAIESIPGAGVVTPVLDALSNTFTVTFAQPGDRTFLNVAQGAIVGALGAATTLQEGSVTPVDVLERQIFRVADSGSFSLRYEGQGTSFLPSGASVAELQAVFDLLAQAAPGMGDVIVSAGADPFEYLVEFQSAGAKSQIQVEGLNIQQQVTEVRKGANTLDSREVQVISYNGLGEFAVNTPVSFSAQEFLAGGGGSVEIQRLSLAGIRAISAGAITLTYGANTTAALDTNSSEVQIAAALNSLQSIIDVGGVTVVAVGGNDVNIVFNTTGDKAGLITGTVVGGVSTPLLPGNTTAAQLGAALNTLTPIVAAGGVTVESVTPGKFNVIYNTPGQKPGLAAYYQVRETQEIDFYQLGEFSISFGANPDDVTGQIAAGASAATVQSALNTLPGVIGAGGVVVTGGVNSRYTIQFNNAGDVQSLSGAQQIDLVNSTLVQGSLTVNEVQTALKPRRFVFDPTNIETGNFVGGFSDPEELEGRKFKWIDSNGNGLYEIDEVPIDGLVAAKVFNQATVNFTPEARIVGGAFTFSSIDGDLTNVEVQTFTIKADKYVLSFGGETTTVLTKKSSALAIETALNALATIQATGPNGVTVVSTAPNTFSVTFGSNGNQAPIGSPFFYDYNNIF